MNPEDEWNNFPAEKKREILQRSAQLWQATVSKFHAAENEVPARETVSLFHYIKDSNGSQFVIKLSTIQSFTLAHENDVWVLEIQSKHHIHLAQFREKVEADSIFLELAKKLNHPA